MAKKKVTPRPMRTQRTRPTGGSALRLRGRRVLIQCLSLVALLMALAVAQAKETSRELRTASHPVDSTPDDSKVVPEGGGEEHGGEKESEGHGAAAVAVGVITVLVLISILFEVFTESLREGTDEMNMPFINTIFSELTTLGFIGLVLFIVTKLDILSTLSQELLGDEKHLQETIEVLHMGLFLFIIIFLVLCVGLLRFGTRVQDEWREFERSSNDIPAVVTEYVLATEPPRSWLERLSLTRRSAARKCHREMVYLALRRRFVDYRSNHPDDRTAMQLAKEFQRNPDVRFPFNEYLSLISGEVMARLIEIDLPTWVALEFFLVGLFSICYGVGQEAEIFVLLISGFVLILLNRTVSKLMSSMCLKLTPPRLMKDAERLRRKNEWRAKHQLPLHDVNEKTWIMEGAETSESDFVPPHIDLLPDGGRHMTELELADAQRALLLPGSGKNGVKLALFCTRLVFLLTALHLSVFLMRTSGQITTHYGHNGLAVAVLFALFLLPSMVVTNMSVRIARDGLYAFNVEHMKANRVIARVMRILKARQTLRTLRFVAEMKIYLQETMRRQSLDHTAVAPVSPLPITAALHEATAKFAKSASKKSPKKKSASEAATPSQPPVAPASPKMSLKQARRQSLSLSLDQSSRAIASPPMSPLAAYYSPRGKRSDAYKLEMERREIHTIFCLFDVDGSGAVSRDEMAGLLRAITHDLSDDQLNRLMDDLQQHQPKPAQQQPAKPAKGSPAPLQSDEEITFESFYNWCHQHIQDSHHSKEELIEEIFRMIDTDASGFITVDEFIAIFKTLGQSLDHDDVRELVYQMDRNDDGKIDLEEFTKMLQKHEV